MQPAALVGGRRRRRCRAGRRRAPPPAAAAAPGSGSPWSAAGAAPCASSVYEALITPKTLPPCDASSGSVWKTPEQPLMVSSAWPCVSWPSTKVTSTREQSIGPSSGSVTVTENAIRSPKAKSPAVDRRRDGHGRRGVADRDGRVGRRRSCRWSRSPSAGRCTDPGGGVGEGRVRLDRVDRAVAVEVPGEARWSRPGRGRASPRWRTAPSAASDRWSGRWRRPRSVPADP